MPYERITFESRLYLKAIERIKETYKDNIWFYGIENPSKLGLPNIIMCFYGHFVAIELRRKSYTQKVGERFDPKYTDASTTASQKKNIKDINRAQGSCFVAYDTTMLMERLHKIKMSLMFDK